MARISIPKFQDLATATDNGLEYSISQGDSSQVLTISISGTATGRTVLFQAKGQVGGWVSLYGYNISNSNLATSTSGTSDEIWQFDMTGIKAVRFPISVIADNSLSVIGELVDAR